MYLLQEYYPVDVSMQLDGVNRFRSLDDCRQTCEVERENMSYFDEVEGSGEGSNDKKKGKKPRMHGGPFSQNDQ